MSRRGVVATGIVFGLACAVTAFVPGMAAAVNAGADGARTFVCNFIDQSMALMADQSIAFDQRTRRFRRLFVASFDLPAIGQEALGRHWHTATLQQRARFLQLFEQQEALIFARRFDYVRKCRLTVASAAVGDGGIWRVPSEVERDDAASIRIEWFASAPSGKWHIVDLSIDEASMAFILRADFGAVLQTNGDKFDSLLVAMQKKIGELT